ncbi:phosphoadenosine phosphosulfate reductase family protein [Pyrofollis japonicus]|uniref:phosphoadenosine phosphosulfate reductase domain-containing protein n=1 Tax=Pyrofollis japonicus TaxID=3060460 RepID=UPI00295AF3C7|nr:phosphoadenosine phosphosulfate reductase family protein [Pyrofollis japonicus]BEP17209.1 phosphoadenosine phosphosulfate reductase family protein [Pyrofollis japonicus]
MVKRIKGEAALRIFRRYVPRLRWCPRCGAPVLGSEKCPKCGGPTLEVKMAPPGDARPAWPKERRELYEAARRELGSEAAKRLLGSTSTFILFNPVQGVDAAYEVIVDGHTIGLFYYEPFEEEWRFRPDRVGAEILANEELAFVLETNTVLRSGQVLRSGLRGDKPGPGGYVVLVGRGPSYGVGRVLDNGAVRVVKAWRRRRRVEWRHNPRPLSIEEAAEMNKEWLIGLEEEAAKWLEETIRRHGFWAVAAISGGKDSTVAAKIAQLAGVEHSYSIDTGIEHPESLETIDKVVKGLGFVHHTGSPGRDAFWKAAELYGPPARDYRWCTKYLKMAVLPKVFAEFPRGKEILVVTGQRGAESTQRALSPRLAESGTAAHGKHYVALPIQRWSSLEVFLYIVLRRLPMHPLYMEGFDRIGCYMCPVSRLAELKIVEKRHPDLWSKWIGFLRRFARSRGLPDEWIRLGLWRWRFSYPSEAQLLARRAGLDPDRLLERLNSGVGAAIEYGRRGKSLLITIGLHDPVDPGLLPGLVKATGLEAARISDGEAVLRDPGSGAEMRLSTDGRIELTNAESLRDIRGAAKAVRAAIATIYMASYCLGCGLCEASCPYNAVTKPYPAINAERCTGCRRCINACPATNQADYVEGVVFRLLKQLKTARR